MNSMSACRPDRAFAGAAGGRFGRFWAGSTQTPPPEPPAGPLPPAPTCLAHQPTGARTRPGSHEQHVGVQARSGFRWRRGWAIWTILGRLHPNTPPGAARRPPAARADMCSPSGHRRANERSQGKGETVCFARIGLSPGAPVGCLHDMRGGASGKARLARPRGPSPRGSYNPGVL